MALVLAFGSWSWRWSHEVRRAINSNTIRMFRIMAHVVRCPDEPWLDGHMRSRRHCQTWLLLREGAPWGTEV